MNQIRAILEADADGTLHLPVPSRVTVLVLPTDRVCAAPEGNAVSDDVDLFGTGSGPIVDP
jgi:hypothetical protein